MDNQRKANHWREQRSKLSLHNYKNEPESKMQLEEFDEETLKRLLRSLQATKAEIAELEASVQNAKPNLSVLEEYRRREEEYNERVKDLNEITRQRDEVKNEVERLRKQRLDEFMHGFNIISQKLKEMYQMITMGGNAELELVDSLDPFSEGIVFSVMPPKKSWKNISNLSGGEKTLSSLALVFALHHFKPTPLYVMDEIDAALDFRNVSIVANYIAERTKNAQFVIISLRNNMFELADRLVGIYKTNDCTKSIAINPSMIATLTASNINPFLPPATPTPTSSNNTPPS
ncbi:P-loop containing nucleoside triphosphate hydrolase protein [Dichotomocladium elegans]|nr:P-loop containing nucleoside triphosphate hydrolase protein [Dichotomocladium elegans]